MTIEADETYLGPKMRSPNEKGRQGSKYDKMKVVGLVERGGRAHMFHVAGADSKTVHHILVTNADRKSHLRTDEAMYYRQVGLGFFNLQLRIAGDKKFTQTITQRIAPERTHGTHIYSAYIPTGITPTAATNGSKLTAPVFCLSFSWRQ